MVTREQVKATVNALVAIAEAIREAQSIPAGHLYAMCMGHMSLEQFERFVHHLEQAELVRRDGQRLVWTGPTELE